jgi:hypothetical protein
MSLHIRIADEDERTSTLPVTPADFARDAVQCGMSRAFCPYPPDSANAWRYYREFDALMWAKQAEAEGRIAPAVDEADRREESQHVAAVASKESSWWQWFVNAFWNSLRE